MNLLEIGKTIVGNYLFMRSLTKNYGEPVNPNEEESRRILNDLMKDRMMDNKFAVLFNIAKFEAEFYLNTERFLKYSGSFQANKFFNSLHPDFIADYLKYARATYAFIHDNKNLFSPLNQCARSTIPLKLKDGRYHWVLQEAVTFHIDAENNLLSHLNIYTVLRPMEDGENVSVVSHLYNNGYEVTEWTQMIWKNFFTSHSFELTPEQHKIVDVLNKNLDFSNSEIAEILNKKKNTIDIQNKQILARARVAYPNHPFENIKEVVKFIREIGYFNDGNELTD